MFLLKKYIAETQNNFMLVHGTKSNICSATNSFFCAFFPNVLGQLANFAKNGYELALAIELLKATCTYRLFGNMTT